MTERDLNTLDSILRNPFIGLSQVEIKILRKAIDLLRGHFAGEKSLACVFWWIYDHEFRYDIEVRRYIENFSTRQLFASHFIALIRKLYPGFSTIA